MDEAACDVLVAGGSLGGVAAALAAGRRGARVCLLAETDWIGGQLTAQGVCTPDENRWIETMGGTASYRALRERIREHYRTRHRLSETGRSHEFLNPGSCWVSRLSVEPRVALRLLREMLATLPNIEVWYGTRAVAVEMEGDTVRFVLAAGPGGVVTRFRAPYVLDATDTGDLLPLAGMEHALGAESRAETGEPDAPEEAQPGWIQPFTFPFALEMRPAGEDHTIPAPPRYAEMKALQRYHILDGAMREMFGDFSWWTYRRVIAAANFDDPAFPGDVAMINTGSNDFMGGVYPAGSPETDAETLARGRLASLGYVYWLQTECPRHDNPARRGYPEFRLRGDWFGTPDGIAPQPYIRESRRIRAMKTVREHEIVAADASGAAHQAGPRAAQFEDSVGIGHYWLDIHQGGTPEPGRFFETRPYQIPLGALIPVRVLNLLPACKNPGVTHLTNGAFRLHPVEWNVGEAAGALAAFCIARRAAPRAVWEDEGLRRDFQRELVAAGVPLHWWTDLPDTHPAFAAAQLLATWNLWPGGETLEFRPDDPLTAGERAALPSVPDLPDGIPRGEAAIRMLDRLEGR